MVLKRKIITPPIGKPKIHWDSTITKAFNYVEYDLPECRHSPLFKYIPQACSDQKVYDLNLSEKVAPLDVMTDGTGKPLILYHCTDSAFEEFYPLSFFGTKTAAKTVGFELACCHRLQTINSCHIPDYQQVKEKKLIDEMAWLQLQNVQKLRLIPVCLHLKNPLKVTDTLTHTIDDFKNIILSFFEQESYSALMKTKFPILQQFGIAKILLDYACAKMPPVFDMIFKEPLQMRTEDIAKELRLEKLFQVKEVDANASDNDKKEAAFENVKNISLQRMIRYLEKRGYDGFAFRNWTDDNGSMTYIAFRPEQIIRLDRKLPPHLFQNRPSAAHEKRLLMLETKALRHCQERPLTENEKIILSYMQMDMLRDIPAQEVRKSRRLQELAKKRGWQRADREYS